MAIKAGICPRSAMILAAGLGKRMRPVTATTPKPLIEIAGKALIDHGLDKLASAGVERCVVNVHYLADLVEVHVSRREAPKVVISDERGRLLETGGGVTKALPLLGAEPFFLLNSDSTWIEGVVPNLELLSRHWNNEAMDALLLLSEFVDSIGYDGRGDFDMDKEGRLSRRKERSVSPFAYAGAAILHPRLFNSAPEGAFSLNRLFDEALEAGRLYGVLMEGIWLHVGTPDAIAAAERAVLESVD